MPISPSSSTIPVITKLPLIFCILSFLTLLLVATLSPIAPVDKVVSAMAAAHHDAYQTFLIATLMLLHRVFCHHVSEGKPSDIKDRLHIHGEESASYFGTEFAP